MNKKDILKFIHEAENLKKELRHSWLSDGRQESVAEHSWRLSIMAILMSDKLDDKIDLLKVLKMVTIHDIAELYAGDVPAFQDIEHKKQKEAEKTGMEKLKAEYNTSKIDEIYNLWHEYEKQESLEAKLVKTLDKIEVRIQHNEAKIDTWNDIEYPRSQFVTDKYCEYDNFLKEFNELIKEESKNKITNESDQNIEDVISKAKDMATKQ